MHIPQSFREGSLLNIVNNESRINSWEKESFPTPTSSNCWNDGLSSIINALENFSFDRVIERAPNLGQLYCFEPELQSTNKPLFTPSRSKRVRDSEESNSFYADQKLMQQVEEEEFIRSFQRLKSSLGDEGSLNISRVNETLTITSSMEYPKKMTSFINHQFSLNQTFNELNTNPQFINWIQTRSSSLEIEPHDLFDQLKQQLRAIYSFIDHFESQSLSPSPSTAYFSIRTSINNLYPALEWINLHFSSSDLDKVAPSWRYVKGRMLALKNYVEVVEDMFRLTEIKPQNTLISVLSDLIFSKINLYGTIIKDRGQQWAMQGFPQVTEIIDSVHKWLESAVVTSINETLPSIHSFSSNLFDEGVSGFSECFRLAMTKSQLAGCLKGPEINGLYQLITLFTTTTSQLLDQKIALSKSWELWAVTRFETITILLSDLTELPCTIIQAPVEGFTESKLCFSLVDSILRVYNALTPAWTSDYGSMRRTNSRRNHQIRLGLKPSAHLLIVQIIKLISIIIKLSKCHQFEPQLKVFSDRINLSLL